MDKPTATDLPLSPKPLLEAVARAGQLPRSGQRGRRDFAVTVTPPGTAQTVPEDTSQVWHLPSIGGPAWGGGILTA